MPTCPREVPTRRAIEEYSSSSMVSTEKVRFVANSAGGWAIGGSWERGLRVEIRLCSFAIVERFAS